jgi:hypothetical protein
MVNTLSVSGHCARLLLAAFNSADLSRLKSALDLAEGVQLGRLPYAEQERIELVHEIAAVIRHWMDRPGTGEDLKTSLDLLRHLSQTVPAPQLHIKKTVLPVTEAARLEMPVYAQR